METSVKRFKPLKLSHSSSFCSLTTRNRVVVPPMASETADLAGFATPRTIAHYGRVGQSGAGIVIAEYSYVHLSGRSEENQLGISADAHIPGLAEIAAEIHAAGALAGIQLTHSGGKSDRALTRGELMGPSTIAVPVKNRVMETPRAMTRSDLQDWENSFLSGAGRAVKAGFDLIELHAAHGYGLNQWLSPLTNQRTDAYGGNTEGRARLLYSIVRNIRAAFPTLLISVRLPGQDLAPGGLEVQDSIEIAGVLETLGVNVIHVSSGIGGWRRPKEREGEGYLVPEALRIQAAVSIPVIGVGGIESADYIENVLAEDSIRLVAVGRAILAGPAEWRNRVLTNALANQLTIPAQFLTA